MTRFLIQIVKFVEFEPRLPVDSAQIRRSSSPKVWFIGGKPKQDTPRDGNVKNEKKKRENISSDLKNRITMLY